MSSSVGAARRTFEYIRVLPFAAGRYPTLFYPMLCTVKGITRGLPVTRETDLVIEGFPRCANTFAVTAFRIAQPNPVRIASHLHVPAQIVRASRMGIPACVVIREPNSVVRSMVLKYPFLRPIDVLRGYSMYYEACARYRGTFVVASFDRVTTDFGRVTDAINTHFGTCFARFDHTEENVSKVFESLDSLNRSQFKGRSDASDRPLPAKECRKSEVPLNGCDRMLARCEAIYRSFARWSV